MKIQCLILSIAIMGMAACASKTYAPSPEPVIASAQPTLADVCAKMAELHAAQKNAHDSAAQITDPAFRPSMDQTLKLLDGRVSEAEARVAAQGIVCQ